MISLQFLKIKNDMSLPQLINIVGTRNIDNILSLNSLIRTPNIGQQFYRLSSEISKTAAPVSYHKKVSILNTFTSDYDVFEAAALLDDDGWKMLDTIGTMPGMLRISETLNLPDSVDILGGTSQPVSKMIYDKAMNYLNASKDIDPVIFNEYSNRKHGQIVNSTQTATTSFRLDNPIQWFKLPWGLISLHSSISNTSIDFPVFPKGFSDGVSASYDTMPEMIYQYEPWYVYTRFRTSFKYIRI